VQASGIHKKKVGIWVRYLGTCENASLIVAAIARRGHGKVGTLAEGFETGGMDEEVSACGVKREVREVNGIVVGIH